MVLWTKTRCIMEIWPIDFDKSLEEIAEWHKQWKAERYGSDSLNPSRYYNGDDRYLYGVREGASLNDEKAESDRMLEILCRLRLINQRLKGTGLSQHLQWQEREQIKTERETLYREFLDRIQGTTQNNAPEPQQKANRGRKSDPFANCMVEHSEKEKRLEKLHTLIDGKKGKEAGLYILAAIKIGWIRKPTFTQVKNEFQLTGSKQGFNDYSHIERFTDVELNGAIESLK